MIELDGSRSVHPVSTYAASRSETGMSRKACRKACVVSTSGGFVSVVDVFVLMAGELVFMAGELVLMAGEPVVMVAGLDQVSQASSAFASRLRRWFSDGQNARMSL